MFFTFFCWPAYQKVTVKKYSESLSTLKVTTTSRNFFFYKIKQLLYIDIVQNIKNTLKTPYILCVDGNMVVV